MKGIKGFEEFDFYDDPKRHQTIFFLPLTSPIHKIAFPNGNFSFTHLLDMSKEKVEKIKFPHDLSSNDSNSSLMPSSEQFIETSQPTKIHFFFSSKSSGCSNSSNYFLSIALYLPFPLSILSSSATFSIERLYH